jgi:hypothetical protein
MGDDDNNASVGYTRKKWRKRKTTESKESVLVRR